MLDLTTIFILTLIPASALMTVSLVVGALESSV
jgi:hypothetical protein